MSKLLWSIVLVLVCKTLSAQQFGGTPPSVRWKQLNTDTARIIYQSGLDSTAQRITSIVHKLAAAHPYALGNKLRKVDIVLQNQTVTSNGYVSLGPYRSEFYLTPPPDNFDQGPLHWADQLALHEYRHVAQYNNFNKGASKLMKKLFGEDGYAVAINAAVPNWFFEGDAVYQETALSKQGRGRLPSFLSAYPALWQAGKNYSWMKLRNGSFKDYVPNHYNLGYLMVNYGYSQYGPDFWGKITSEASAYKGLIYPFQNAVKRNTGMSYDRFITNAFQFYKRQYGLDGLPDSRSKPMQPPTAVLPVNTKTLTNYYFPQQIGTDSLLYLKASNKQRPAFYLKDKNGEHFLRYRDLGGDYQFSYKNGRLVYAATETDPRWSWLTYSVLRVLDLKTGWQKSIARRTRYFTPDIAADGKQLVANQVALDGTSSLVLLDVITGRVLKEMKRPDIEYFANPKIRNHNQAVCAIRTKNSLAYIGLIDWVKNEITALTPPSYKTVGQISIEGNRVYFTASTGLKDEIHSVDIPSKQLFQLPYQELTGYYVNTGFGKINWSSFTADGFQLRQIAESPNPWIQESKTNFLAGTTGIISPASGLDTGFLDMTLKTVKAKKYAKLSHPFNFHSWRPNYSDPEYSFTFYGNNVLNTTQTQLYYSYNENDRTNAVGGSLIYGGLYPYIGIGSQYTIGRKIKQGLYVRQWDQWDNYLSLNVPLNWNHGTVYRFFNVGTNLGYRMDFKKGADKDLFTFQHFGYLTHSLGIGEQVQRAVQDIYPRWGYSINGQYRYSVNKYKGWQAVGKATLYLPGFFPAHSLVLTAAVQESGTKDRLFGSQINFARGFNGVDSNRMGSVTANYHVPLWYPDWGVGNIVYLQRVRANIFYDYMGIKGKQSSFYFGLQSAGAEIYVDTQWWNQHPITFGFRSGRLLTKDLVAPARRWFYEFILPVSIIPR